jgi:hypothetical protein
LLRGVRSNSPSNSVTRLEKRLALARKIGRDPLAKGNRISGELTRSIRFERATASVSATARRVSKLS